MYDVSLADPPPQVFPSRTEFALTTIKQGILSGRYAPGQALVESEIAKELGVSKTPVREALKTLEMSGLVVMRPYSGTRVRQLTMEDAVAIYDLRLLLEPEAVRRSVANGLALDPARDSLERARGVEDAPVRSLENRAFHAALWAAAGNPELLETLENLRDRTALVAVATWARRPSWELEAQEHAGILQAAEAGDADEASALTRAHIAGFLDRMRTKGGDI
ncbi:MAG TPA: GntR family transcriptional regulator [Candidatus Brachybacterium merdigallinarum]|nr:GntR family transcriptional regulator [Candidatus Brachybacterium merdigallinarum]